ncbi:COG5 Conserved oligomeric Golgi complex subunit 5 [Candida maltosa Xu316]
MTDNTLDELEDFETYLESNFEPQNFANELIVATNGRDNSELDLITSIKKLKFDIDECDKRMNKISSSNYDSLISNFQQIADFQSILNNRLNPNLERIYGPMNRIKNEVIKPYDDAVSLNNALKRIHLTLELLRNTNLVRLAKLHTQIKELYGSATKEKSSEINVLSIKIIRDYQANATSKRATLINQCTNTVSGDFNHLSTLEYKNSKLQSSLCALYILDPIEFYNAFDRSTISRQVQQSVNQLTRALQSPRNFTAIISEVKESSGEYFTKLTDVLTNWNTGVDDHTLLETILSHYKVESLSVLFWTKLNQKFKKNIVAAMARGGPIAKNLKVYSQGIKASVSEMFKSETERDLLLDSLAMIDYK